ncbi:MAG: hypothetical protein GY788_02385 [bacterium]|nr:hypothetical protein [bacterium]
MDQAKKLLEKIGKSLTEYGFRADSRTQSFLRDLPVGKAALHISIIQHKDEFDVTADIGIRFDKVEDLVNQENNLISRREKAQTFTVGGELGNLSIGSPLRWGVAKMEDVPRVADEIVEAYVRIGEPYIVKYSDLKVAYELMSRDDQVAWIQCPFHGERAKRAVAAAHILGEVELDKLIRKKEEFLIEMNDFGLDEFTQFASKLRSTNQQ